MAGLPTGTVTFLFTDLEGSTRLWEEHPDGMRDGLARHDEILRDAVQKHDGHVVKTTGDGLHAVFGTAHDALEAAVDAQGAVTDEAWTLPEPLRVRMGVHTGESDLREGDYYGGAVNRAARLASTAHGGQVVVSHATEELVRDRLPHDVSLLDLGEHHLRDLTRPERVFQVRSPGLPDSFPPLRSLDAFPGNLPPRATSFIGREREIDKVAGALRESPLVTLTGVGGVGKTRLALQVAAEVLPSYRDGAWFCELAAASDPEALVQVVAAALGVPNRSGMDLEASVVEFLRTKQLLLVLDNCEHLLDVAGDFAERLVAHCPGVRTIATSREGLGVDGEQVVPLRSLPLPQLSGTVEAIGGSDAVRLFVERARVAQSEFALTEHDASAIAEICRRLDGMPLAIELAAARAVALSPAEIAALLDERFRLLTGGRRSAVERHQTLRATVDWSYDLLDERERRVFERLGAFAGTFDADAATAVVTGEGIERFDVLDALTNLIAKSMIVAERGDDGTTRYYLLETLRQYARERLDETQTADDWRRRHAEHYAAFAEQAAPQLKGPDELEWHTRIIRELDNLRAAVTWGLDSPDDADADLAFRIVAAVAMQGIMRRSTGIGTWALRALERQDAMTPGQRFDARCGAVWDLFQRGDVAAARDLAALAIDAGVPLDANHTTTAHLALATSCTQLGDIDAAMAAYEAAESISAEQRDDYFDAALWSGRAMNLAAFGRFSEAQVIAERAITVARRLRNPTAIVLATLAVGWSFLADDPERARVALEECISVSVSGALQGVIPSALGLVAPLRMAEGDPAGAVDALCDAIRWCREIGERLSVNTALDSALTVLTDLGEGEVPAVLAGVAGSEMFGPIEGVSGLVLERREGAVARLRDVLGDDGFEVAAARGAAMSVEEALAYAFTELDRVRSALAPSA